MSIENQNLNQEKGKEASKEEFEIHNFNDSVWVKLTERGKEILGGEVEVDKDGYTEMTFSDLMRTFGHEISMNKTTELEGEKQLPFYFDFKIKRNP